MYVIKYTKSPRGYYVGYIKGDKRIHFFAGETEKKLYERGRKTASEHYKASPAQVCLEARPTPAFDFPHHLIDEKWRAVWWTGVRKDGSPASKMGWKRTKKVVKKPEVEDAKPVDTKPVEDKPKFAFHITRKIGNKMYVFGCLPVAEYDLEVEEPLPKLDEPLVGDSYTNPEDLYL